MALPDKVTDSAHYVRRGLHLRERSRLPELQRGSCSLERPPEPTHWLTELSSVSKFQSKKGVILCQEKWQIFCRRCSRMRE